MEREQLGRAVGAAAMGLGAVGLLAPGALARSYGVTDDGSTRALERLFATRNLVIGALAFTATPAELPKIARYAFAMNVADVLGAGVALAKGHLPTARAAQLAVTSGAFAVVTALVAKDAG